MMGSKNQEQKWRCCSLCLKLLGCVQIFEFCSQIVTDYINATCFIGQ